MYKNVNIFMNRGCKGFTEVRDGQCRLASGWNPNPVTLHEEKEHVPRFNINCFDRTIFVKAEQPISLDSQSVNSTREWAECSKHVAKSHASKTKSGCHKKSDIGIRGKDTYTHKRKHSTLGKQGEEEQMQQHEEETQSIDLQTPYVVFFLLFIKRRKTG